MDYCIAVIWVLVVMTTKMFKCMEVNLYDDDSCDVMIPLGILLGGWNVDDDLQGI